MPTITPGQFDLTTLAKVKEYLQIADADTTSDNLLQRIITAGSDYIQSILNRVIKTQAYTDRRNGNGVNMFILSNYPVKSVVSVTIDGRVISPAADDSSPGFIFDDDAVYLRGYVFSKGIQNVAINYTAGFDTIPPIIDDFCIEMVARKYKYKDRVGQVSKILGGETVTFEKADLTDDMKSILRNYAKVVPV